jgi:hypothetical protein
MGNAGPDASTGDASSDASQTSTDPCTGVTGTAPTYTQLYANWFATGKPGHCANAACHGGTANIWQCGADKNTCFNGMKGDSLIDTANPKNSRLIDPDTSPLRWFNPTGAMPQDNPVANTDGKNAILAWVCAGAQNN